MPNVGVDQAAHINATFAAPGLLRNTLPAAPVHRVVGPAHPELIVVAILRDVDNNQVGKALLRQDSGPLVGPRLHAHEKPIT
jgi:hypothetical protein